jgi:L-glyceraldehyde 3-phosphate reductase
MRYNRCGASGLKLPAVSLGMWHNFGGVDEYSRGREIALHAFDLGITHFDLANNYGPPAGSAEENFGRLISRELKPYRDELVISTKSGYYMWEGPYGEWGSRKQLLASLDQSLRRMKLDYVDIFYHHRPDPDTPLEETCLALDQAVRQGKALYVGISNYSAEQSEAAAQILRAQKTPFVIHQARYSLLDRWIENGLKGVSRRHGFGIIAFSPLAQGLLSDRYLSEIPRDSRAGGGKSVFLTEADITAEKLEKISKLNDAAQERGQTLAQMALSWILRDGQVASVLIGASKAAQLDDCILSIRRNEFAAEELERIDAIVSGTP